MSDSKAAIRYAKSLYSLGKEQGLVDPILADMSLFAQTVKENTNLNLLIQSPIIIGSKKRDILNQIFKPSFQPLTTLFVDLVVAKGRENDLVAIANAFISEYKKAHGINEASVVSAVALSAELKQQVQAKAEQIAGGKVTLTEKVDPSLIGGYILNIKDLQLDESVKSKFSKLKEQLIDSSYVSKI